MRLVTEVHASFEELTHVECGQHAKFPFSGSNRRDAFALKKEALLATHRSAPDGLSVRRSAGFACEMRRLIETFGWFDKIYRALAAREPGRATRYQRGTGARRPRSTTMASRLPQSGKPRLEAAVAGLALVGAMASWARRKWGDAEASDAARHSQHPGAADDPGHQARKPSEIGPRGWREIAWRVYNRISSERLSLMSAGVAFFGLLALFPALAALVALYGFFADPSAISTQLATLQGVVPEEGLAIIRQQVTRLAEQGQNSLSIVFVTGLVISLWSAMSGVKAVFDALNMVYAERERRSFIILNVQALIFTLATLLFILIALAAIVVVPMIVAWFGINNSWLPSLRWPLMYLAILLALAALYRFGPCREPPQWRWVTWGSAIAGLLWIVGSVLFSWYVESFGSYNKTYGSLGAVIAFMVWLWLSALVILLGAEIDAEMEHQTAHDTTTGRERPMGSRGARMADEVA
jgi:membrane protein